MRKSITVIAVWTLGLVGFPLAAQSQIIGQGGPTGGGTMEQKIKVPLEGLAGHEEAQAMGIAFYAVTQVKTKTGQIYTIKLLGHGGGSQGTAKLITTAATGAWSVQVKRYGKTVRVQVTGPCASSSCAQTMTITVGGRSGTARLDQTSGWIKSLAMKELMNNASQEVLDSIKLAALVQTLQKETGPPEEDFSSCGAAATESLVRVAASSAVGVDGQVRPPWCFGRQCVTSNIWGVKSECAARARSEAGTKCCSNAFCYGCCWFQQKERPEGFCFLPPDYLCGCTVIGYACDQPPHR